eukprot:CAMPEP_0172936750 /NCGR_PEP_ID=MMETSP1075-20121228/222174_1 /TAXON_ID=2916 /ORGANISM="Ceratium fusus, Strain PA161109" /LENGTH=155 /DNA_ID=CAMNT_0013798123 /DNA_START=625 /DNA_END=1093 /DNA_ORIENTATION=+
MKHELLGYPLFGTGLGMIQWKLIGYFDSVLRLLLNAALAPRSCRFAENLDRPSGTNFKAKRRGGLLHVLVASAIVLSAIIGAKQVSSAIQRQGGPKASPEASLSSRHLRSSCPPSLAPNKYLLPFSGKEAQRLRPEASLSSRVASVAPKPKFSLL